jgi:hypothetical protein
MRQHNKFERSTSGLRDALFSEMEDLRAGYSDPNEAMAFSRLAEQVIATVNLDFRHAELEDRRHEYIVREREAAIEERKQLLLENNSTEQPNEVNYDIGGCGL